MRAQVQMKKRHAFWSIMRVGSRLACRQETGSLFVNGILQSFVLILAEKVFLCRALFSLVSDVNILLGKGVLKSRSP